MKDTTLNFRAPLPLEQLYRYCDASQFKFKDTSELEDGNLSLGQERAIEAFDLSLSVVADGFNIYAMGIPSSGREEWVKDLLRERAKDAEVSVDWCYVNDFSRPNKPKAISFPAGKGKEFCSAIKQLLEDLCHTIPTAFESSEYQGSAKL